MSKQEKKFWKDKAKMYVKNPSALKGEFENFQEQINDLKTQLKESMSKESPQEGTSSVAANDATSDSLRWQLVQLEAQVQNLRRQNERLQSEVATTNKTSQMGIQDGLVYRVQIGAYVFYEMENKPETGGDFVSERADGFNKYVIGSFRTYEEAAAFRQELKKMGLSDPWVVPYIDGIRVTIDEAEQYQGSQGNSILEDN
ncbi:MAG: SPOR domain-containing protein [Bacteroidota bacterium]